MLQLVITNKHGYLTLMQEIGMGTHTNSHRTRIPDSEDDVVGGRGARAPFNFGDLKCLCMTCRAKHDEHAVSYG